MKYCEYCGKPISDDAVFCSGCGRRCQNAVSVQTQAFCEKCGRLLDADERFCQNCGTPVGDVLIQQMPAQPAVVMEPIAYQPVPQPITQASEQLVLTSDMPTSAAANKRKLPKWVLAVTAVVLVAAIVLGIFALCGGFIKRADLPNPLTEENLVEFMGVVAGNAEGDYACYAYGAEIAFWAKSTVSKDDAPYDSSTVHIRVRDYLNGKVVLKDGYVGITIFTGGDLLGGGDYIQYSKEQYDCARDLIIALEKTLAGKSRADDHLKSYSEMQELAATMEAGFADAKEITYQLNEKLGCTISISRTAGHWDVNYRINVRP